MKHWTEDGFKQKIVKYLVVIFVFISNIYVWMIFVYYLFLSMMIPFHTCSKNFPTDFFFFSFSFCFHLSFYLSFLFGYLFLSICSSFQFIIILIHNLCFNRSLYGLVFKCLMIFHSFVWFLSLLLVLCNLT